MLIFVLSMVALTLFIYISVTESNINSLQGIDPLQGIEPFESMQALDAAPSTNEVKVYYKTLLLYADNDFRGSGVKSMRLLGDMRDRIYGPRNFRHDLKIEDILANWPPWLQPLRKDSDETKPSTEDAVTAELHILSYLQTNFPQEPGVDPRYGSIVTNLIEDFGKRFVFEKGQKIQVKEDFLFVPLTRNWVNPTQSPAK